MARKVFTSAARELGCAASGVWLDVGSKEEADGTAAADGARAASAFSNFRRWPIETSRRSKSASVSSPRTSRSMSFSANRSRYSDMRTLITPLIRVRGYAAPETKAAVERARSLIQQAQALGEPPDDPLLLFSVLFGWWGANAVAFNADACLDLASQFLALAEKQEATGARLIAHRIMGQSLALSGHIAEARLHYDKGLALYDSIAHRPLATRFATDSESSFLSFRSWCMWLLGYPDAALADADRALARAREFGHAAMMHTMFHLLAFHLCCRNHTTAAAIADEFIPLAEDKSAALWKAIGLLMRGCIFAEAGKALDAIETFAAAIAANRATGATVFMPFVLPRREPCWGSCRRERVSRRRKFRSG